MGRTFLVVSVLLLVVACSNVGVYNARDVGFITSSGASPQLADIRRAIVVAATSKNWSVKDIDDTHIEVTLRPRKHMARATIEYSTSAFSITYNDSTNMRFDGDTIHPNYNRWIRNLEVLIKTQISKL